MERHTLPDLLNLIFAADLAHELLSPPRGAPKSPEQIASIFTQAARHGRK
ncbi:MAG: hypothetical protein ACPGVG_18405 [Mycobacterium sp.]